MRLLLPFLCIVLGGLIGYFLLGRSGRDRMLGRRAALWIACSLLLTVLLANSGQTLYELGFPFGAIDIVEGLALFAGFAILAGAWRALHPVGSRWFLLLPAAVLSAQPLLTTFTLAVWSLNGFAP